ncbi:unnamed protein product [Owenia fusiformis]|uniref:Uncharacterized protein n=1 Tax=Owenia fusiformis TaxID=6347 RepID=A0A8J1TFW7_OWEFU|nr:unnamed protein product [Owenia fusiformis]
MPYTLSESEVSAARLLEGSVNSAMLSIGIIFVSIAVAMAMDSNFHMKKITITEPWMTLLKGPNVCSSQEVADTGERYSSKCMIAQHHDICGQETFIRFHCCPGYEILDGEKGCTGVTEMDNLYKSMDQYGSWNFQKETMVAGLQDTLENKGAFTLFSPLDNAVSNMPTEMREQLDSDGENMIKNHVLRGRVYTSSMENGEELTTLSDTMSPIRVNKYDNGITTVNCARIVQADVETTNGLLNTVDRVIQPIHDKPSIFETLLHDPESRFNDLSAALITTELANTLRDNKGPYTIFAPTDEAFAAIPDDILSKVLADRSLLKALLQAHILRSDLCSASMTSQKNVVTMEGSKTKLGCLGRGKLAFGKAKTTKSDILTNNGIIHVIDAVNIPDIIKDARTLLSDMKIKVFTEKMEESGMADMLNPTDGDHTFLVPSDEAFNSMTLEQLKRLNTDPTVLKYHLIPGKITTNDVLDKQLIKTEGLNGAAAQFGVRVSVKRNGYSVNGAKIVDSNHKSGSGIIHVIDRVLFPPEPTVMDVIASNPSLSTFYELIQKSGYEERLRNADGHYTILAPSEYAFSYPGRKYVRELLNDTRRLENWVENHILWNEFHTVAAKPLMTYRMKALNGQIVNISRPNDRPTIVINDDGEITTRDVVSENGVVHIISRVIECEECDELNDDEDSKANSGNSVIIMKSNIKVKVEKPVIPENPDNNVINTFGGVPDRHRGRSSSGIRVSGGRSRSRGNLIGNEDLIERPVPDGEQSSLINLQGATLDHDGDKWVVVTISGKIIKLADLGVDIDFSSEPQLVRDGQKWYVVADENRYPLNLITNRSTDLHVSEDNFEIKTKQIDLYGAILKRENHNWIVETTNGATYNLNDMGVDIGLDSKPSLENVNGVWYCVLESGERFVINVDRAMTDESSTTSPIDTVEQTFTGVPELTSDDLFSFEGASLKKQLGKWILLTSTGQSVKLTNLGVNLRQNARPALSKTDSGWLITLPNGKSFTVVPPVPVEVTELEGAELFKHPDYASWYIRMNDNREIPVKYLIGVDILINAAKPTIILENDRWYLVTEDGTKYLIVTYTGERYVSEINTKEGFTFSGKDLETSKVQKINGLWFLTTQSSGTFELRDLGINVGSTETPSLENNGDAWFIVLSSGRRFRMNILNSFKLPSVNLDGARLVRSLGIWYLVTSSGERFNLKSVYGISLQSNARPKLLSQNGVWYITASGKRFDIPTTRDTQNENNALSDATLERDSDGSWRIVFNSGLQVHLTTLGLDSNDVRLHLENQDGKWYLRTDSGIRFSIQWDGSQMKFTQEGGQSSTVTKTIVTKTVTRIGPDGKVHRKVTTEVQNDE